MTTKPEPPVKIVMVRVTSDDPELTIDQFIAAVKEGLIEVAKNVTVMAEHFAVDGKHVQRHVWLNAQDKGEELNLLDTSDTDEIKARLEEIAQRLEDNEGETLTPQLSRDYFVLGKFAEATTDAEGPAMRELHAMAVGLRTLIQTLIPTKKAS